MREQSGSVMRLAARWLATPVLWYEHGQTGRRLVLVLNSHMGQAGYFAALAARVGELEAAGWQVQAEGIRKAGEAAWAGASDAERDAQQIMLGIYRDMPVMMAHSLGWCHQGDPGVFPPRETWVSADLTDLEVVRAIGPDAIWSMAHLMAEALAKVGAGRRDAYLRAVGPATLRHLARPHGWISKGAARFTPAVHDVLMVQRSKLAAAAADPARDWVLIWGAEHADPIGAALEAAGWALTGKRRWLTVGRVPPLWRTAADVIALAAGVGADTWRAERAKAQAQPTVHGAPRSAASGDPRAAETVLGPGRAR